MQGILKEEHLHAKHFCMNILRYQDILVFFRMCVTLTGKIDPSCPIKPGNYWIDTLKTKTTHRNES